MNVHLFLRTRPCVEEIDGYLEGLRYMIANPDKSLPPAHDVVDAEVLGPIETYKQRLMSGKELPAPSRVERGWKYAKDKKPTKVRRPDAGSRLSSEVIDD